MRMNERPVGFLHYSCHPVIGGVERVMRQHGLACVAHGHPARMVAGTGEAVDPGCSVTRLPELRPDHPLTSQARAEYQAGAPGPAHREAVGRFIAAFDREFAGCGAVWVHNLLTMPFNLACTEALWEWAGSGRAPRLVHWTHDLGAINPDYHLETELNREPWNRLTLLAPGFEYVAISETRRREMATLFSEPESRFAVVPNPLDARATAGLEEPLAEWLEGRGIWERDLVLLHPTRILRRKNVELTISCTGALRRLGVDAFAIITGAPDPFNQASATYAEALRRLIAETDLEEAVGFVQEKLTLGEREIAQLFQTADLLFYPSRMEGFGLPLLEAGWFRLPAAVAAIPPLLELADPEMTWAFDPGAAPERVAEGLLDWLNGLSAHTWRRRLLEKHRLSAIWETALAPRLGG